MSGGVFRSGSAVATGSIGIVARVDFESALLHSGRVAGRTSSGREAPRLSGLRRVLRRPSEACNADRPWAGMHEVASRRLNLSDRMVVGG